MKKITDNKEIWRTIRPFLSDKIKGIFKMNLV